MLTSRREMILDAKLHQDPESIAMDDSTGPSRRTALSGTVLFKPSRS